MAHHCDVGLHEIHHMDVVSDAGPIRGGVVAPRDGEMRDVAKGGVKTGVADAAMVA
eukprot:CAMPEP_0117692824 /NCGR_PEP_ID=MMETSP0804-20121206/26532_1 /TAXON_ID=1074897 /ORGANISM="Tetraselmis astigmatica, Strain CCMP880" /LENGTH=55 /DNA_ID=CAMNT_0005506295 /DNA_START=243 /DNA_END=410 /DNA_ORIENTATION=-